MNSTPTETSLSTGSPRRWPKRLLLGSAIIIMLLGLLGLGLWRYIRSDNFNRFVVEQIKNTLREYGLRAELGSFGIAPGSLLTPTVALRDFKIYNQQTNQLIATVKTVTAEAEIREPYARRLSRDIVIKTLKLDGVDVRFDVDAQGRTNFDGVHDVPPRAGRIKFDTSQILVSLAGGTLHYTDQSRQLTAELAELNGRAQPSPQGYIGAELSGGAGHFGYEGRASALRQLALDARIFSNRVELKNLKINADAAEVKVEGRLDDFAALRYGLDVEVQAKLTEAARVFLPDFVTEGSAALNAHVDGQGANYQIKGKVDAGEAVIAGTKLSGAHIEQVEVSGDAANYQAKAAVRVDEINAAGVRLREVRVGQINVQGQGAQLTFNGNNVRAQSLNADGATISGLAVNNFKGEVKDGRAQISTPAFSVGQVNASGSRFDGLSLSNVTANIDGTKYEARAAINLRSATVNNAQISDVSAQASVNNTVLALTNLKAKAFGGTLVGEASVPQGRGGTTRAKVNFNDLQTSDAFALLDFKDAPLAGRVRGEAEISLVGSNLKSLNGRVTAHLDGQTSQTADTFPLTGDVALTARNGSFNIEQLQLATDATKLEASGQLSVEGDSDLRVTLTSTQAEQLVQIARSLEAARQFVTDYEPQLLGDFKFDGRVAGKLQQPTIEGDLSAANVGLRDALLGALSGRIYVSPVEARVQGGLLSATNGGTIKFELHTPLDPKGNTGKLDAVIDKVDLETILAAAGAPDAGDVVSGNVSGEAHLTGLPAAFDGTAQVALTDGIIAKQPAQLAQAKVRFANQRAELDEFIVKLPQGQLKVDGSLNLADYSFRLSGKAEQLALDDLAQTLELRNTTITGTAESDFTVSGRVLTQQQVALDWESLQIYLMAQGKDVRVNGRAMGELQLSAQTSAGGRVDVSLLTGILTTAPSTGAQGKAETLRGSIELRQPGRPITVESDLTDLNIAPLLDIFAPGVSESLSGTVTGRLRIAGPSADAQGNITTELLRGGLTLTDTTLNIAGTPIKVATPVVVTYEGTQLRVQDTSFTGAGVDLRLGGTLGLTSAAGMNFALNGTVSLDKLPALADVTLAGTATVDVRATGNLEAPQLAGQVAVNDLSVSAGRLPVYISNGAGRLVLAGDQLTLERFTANANEGRVELSGQTKLAGFRPSEWRYEVAVNDVDIIYQELSATLAGTLTLNGTPQGQTLAGSINVPQAEYATAIDLDNLLAGGAAFSGFGDLAGGGSGGPALTGIPPVDLNIRVEARDTLIIRSKQINAVGSALLTVAGRLDDPRVIGRIESEGGAVRFRDQRYEITTATLDLPSVGSDVPVLNLQAEGDVSGYRVNLGLSGPVDQIDIDLRSDPGLARDEILSLITTGRTEAGTIAGQDPLRSGVSTVGSFLSQGLISRPTEQLLGLSRFQIDPVLGPNNNPAARLTIAQQLSRDFYLRYSTNLGEEQQQTALAEYTFSNRFSALASFTQGGSSARQASDDNVFTIELRGRQRFALGFKPAVTPTTSDPRPALARIARPSALVEVTPVPDVKLGRTQLRELLPVMTQGFSQPLRRLGERRLVDYLQERGYFFATVRSRCEPADCSGPSLQLFYEIEPNVRYDLKEIRIEGTNLIAYDEIKGELQSQPAGIVGNVPLLKTLPLIGGLARGLTSNDRLKNDEETIRRRLVDTGFRQARVQSRLAFSPDDDNLIVIFDVTEGVQSEIADVILRGNAILDAGELRQAVPIKPGEAFSFSRARTGAQQIRQLYAERGFLQANAELQVVDLDEDSVQLIYNVTEGARALVSEITINGTTKTKSGFVRRYFDFKVGDVLTPLNIRTTQRDLYATNAFREVAVRVEPVTGGDGSAQKVAINLTEAKPLLMVYGLGYSTDDGPRGLFEVTHTNLLGTLDSLSLRLRASQREQLGQMSFTDLRPFGTKFPTTISIFHNRSSRLRTSVRQRIIDTEDGERRESDPNDQSFGVSRFAAFIQTERKLADRTSLRFRYNLERANLFNIEGLPLTEVTRNERAIRLGMFSAGITHDTRDNVLNPSRGQLYSADHSLAANIFGGNESFNKFFGTFQNYYTLAPQTRLLRDTTLAFAARIGAAAVFRQADRNNDGMISDSERRLPISERFFSGGATTLRGFRFETAGPQGVLEPRTCAEQLAALRAREPEKMFTEADCVIELPSLVPLGGDALAVFNFELRYPLTRRLRLVPFYDLGNVFRSVKDFSFSGMTNTVGLGLRINTPLGPVGVDYGFLLDPPAYVTARGEVLRQPRAAFHIRFGQTF